jgi:hypothetical protein
MKYYYLPFILLLISGCTQTPTPQSKKEIEAKNMIQTNISEAEQAKHEYLTLQKKRQKETSL